MATVHTIQALLFQIPRLSKVSLVECRIVDSISSDSGLTLRHAEVHKGAEGSKVFCLWSNESDPKRGARVEKSIPGPADPAETRRTC